MRTKISLALLKQKFCNNIYLLRLKVTKYVAILMHHIEVQRALDKCPDERSRSILKACIENRDRDLDIRYARIRNYQQQMEVGFLDMIEAIMVVYDNPKGENDTMSYTEAVNLFNSGKSKVLMYSRWMCQMNPGSCARKWIDLIGPIDINTFNTVDEWQNFVANLPVY